MPSAAAPCSSPLRNHRLAALAATALLASAACTGNDATSRAHLLASPERAGLDLSGRTADALGGPDALAFDALGDAGGSTVGGTLGGGDDGPGGHDRPTLERVDAWTTYDAKAPLDATIAGADAADPAGDVGPGPDATSEPDAGPEPDARADAGSDGANASDGATASDASANNPDPDAATDAADALDAADVGRPDVAPGGPPVDWCRLYYPSNFNVRAGATVQVTAHVYVPGQTDQSANAGDPAPWLVAEVGYGPHGASPALRPDDFTWRRGAIEMNPPAWVFWRDDRYLTDLVIDTPGYYDYGARFSSDFGQTWLYCDLDGSQNGYAVAQSGQGNVRP